MESKQINTEKKQVNYEQLDNTPFTLVEKDNSWYVLLGDTAVIQTPFKSRFQAKRYVREKPWNLLANTICVITTKIIEYEKDKKTNSSPVATDNQ